MLTDMRSAPVKYFEAKPRRAIDFSEVRAAIIPDTASESVKQALIGRGIRIINYNPADSSSRLRAVNEAANETNVRFSLKRTPPTDTDARRAQNREDRKNFGISVNSLTKDIFDNIGIRSNRRNEAEEAEIRNALSVLKEGREDEAKDILKKTFTDLYREARQPLSDRDKDFLKAVRSTPMDLSADVSDLQPEELRSLRSITKSTTTGRAGTKKGADVEITELKEQFPEYFPESGDSPAKQIYDAYTATQSKQDNALYNPFYADKLASDLADSVISQYHESRPALSETPKERSEADTRKYGVDIEQTFRSLGIRGMSES
ncbi:MAG: hypothetical protein ACI38A_04700, partial [Candidatus Ornithomonoglobus sp.]